MKATITPRLIQEGASVGTPCLFVDLLDDTGKEMETNEIMNVLVNSKTKHVVFNARPSETPDVCTMIRGLASKSRIPTLQTFGNEKIDPFRIIRGARMFVTTDIPDKQTGSVQFGNFALYKEDDQVLFSIGTEEDYDKVVGFLTARTITRPTILFSLSTMTPEAEKAVVSKFFRDSTRFTFKAKVTRPSLIG